MIPHASKVISSFYWAAAGKRKRCCNCLNSGGHCEVAGSHSFTTCRSHLSVLWGEDGPLVQKQDSARLQVLWQEEGFGRDNSPSSALALQGPVAYDVDRNSRLCTCSCPPPPSPHSMASEAKERLIRTGSQPFTLNVLLTLNFSSFFLKPW